VGTAVSTQNPTPSDAVWLRKSGDLGDGYSQVRSVQRVQSHVRKCTLVGGEKSWTNQTPLSLVGLTW